MVTMASIMAATTNIMPTESDGRPVQRRRRRGHRSAAAAALVLGTALLGLAGPRLIAAGLSLDARAVSWDLEETQAPPQPQRLAAAAAGLAAADDWVVDGQGRIDRSLLLLRQAETVPTGDERDHLQAAAEASAVAGLAQSPGQPSAWARLARLRLARGDHSGAAAAFRLSLLSGAVVPTVMTWRLELGLQLRPHLDPDTLALIERQIRLTWILQPDYVARLATRPGEAMLVRQALDALSQQEVQHYLRLHSR